MNKAKAIEIRDVLRMKRDAYKNHMKALSRITLKDDVEEEDKELVYYEGVKQGLEMAIDLLRNEIRTTPLEGTRLPLRYNTAENVVARLIDREGIEQNDYSRSRGVPETSQGCRDLEALFSIS